MGACEADNASKSILNLKIEWSFLICVVYHNKQKQKQKKQDTMAAGCDCLWFDDVLFDELYESHIEDNLVFYNDNVASKAILDNMTEETVGVIYNIELEFNEERGIELELEVDTHFVLEDKDVFRALVSEAIIGNIESLEEFCDAFGCGCSDEVEREYSGSKILAMKLKHLIGQDLYDKFMACGCK